MKKEFQSKLPVLVIILIAIMIPIFINNNYILYVLTIVFIYSVMTMALNLLMGVGGQTSIGNAAFATIGAYAAALLSKNLGLPFYICILFAGAISAVIGFVIGLPSVRLTGHYLAVATLGFGVAIPQIALKWESLTNGFMGLNVKRASMGGFEFKSDVSLYLMNLVILLASYWTINNIIKSRYGRRFSAIRDSEVAAQAMGIRLLTNKAFLFTISAFYTGIAGALYAFTIRYVSPNDFSIAVSFNLVTMIVLGGISSLSGSIIGAAVVIILNQLTNQLLGVSEVISGLVMVIIILFFPKGIAGLADTPFIQKFKLLTIWKNRREGGKVN